MTPKMVIFDCDGVLVDSERPLHQVLVGNLAKYGLNISVDQSLATLSGMVMSEVARLATEQGASLPHDWEAEIYEAIFDRIGQGVPLSAGTVELLDRLENAGVAVAVASNGPMHKMQLSLGPHGLFDRLQGRIFSAHGHGAGKPAPDLLLAAAAGAGVPPEHCIMVDDSPAGYHAAIAAGTGFVGYSEHAHGPVFDANTSTANSMQDLSDLIFGAMAVHS